MKIKTFTVAALALLVNLLPLTATAENWPQLRLDEIILESAKGETVEIAEDPVYRAAKRYRARPLQPFLERLSKRYPGDLGQAVVVFTATDGYRAWMTYADALKEAGYIAYKDLDAGEKKWKSFKFGTESMTPDPYYLVWSKPGIDKWRYPWPFQLERIGLEPPESFFGKAAPTSKNARVKRGFDHFARYCIRCHAINGSGGEVGPELNRPINVGELYPSGTLRELILNNPGLRPESKMPGFKDVLDTAQVNDIVAYLHSMKTPKQADETNN